MAPSFVNKILGKLDGDDNSSDTKTSSSSSAGHMSSSSHPSRSSRTGTGQDTSNVLSTSSAQDTTRGGLGDATQTSTSQGTGTSSTPTSRAKGTGSTIAEADEQFETVDYANAPAVEHERVTRTNQEVVQAVVDRERHQDHYKTTVQPIADKQVLAEKHRQQTADVQEREFEHEDAAKTKARLASEAQQFQSSRVEVDGGTTTSKAATQVKEHVHHHMHETVQPVIEREILQNTVTHTLVPVHETHHEAPHFHTSTTNPVMSLADFNKQAGTAVSETTSHESSAIGTATSGPTTHGTTTSSRITRETS